MSKRNGLSEFKHGIAFGVPNNNLEAVTFVSLDGNADVQGVVCTIIQYIETAPKEGRTKVLNVILNSAMAVMLKNPEVRELVKRQLGF